MRTSGLILDLYDDSRGDVLRELYPSREELPEIVKQAHALSPGERQALPDDVFALVLIDGDDKLRKYACTDRGNTILSVGYFLRTGHRLPEEAQKTAAVNLQIACSWYGIKPPEELEKTAIAGFLAKRVMANPIGSLQMAYTAPAMAKGVHQEMQARNQVASAAGGNVVTPHQVQDALGRKHAEVTGSPDMPLQGPGTKPAPAKAVVKLSEMGHLVPGHGGQSDDLGPEEHPSKHLDNRQQPSLPQMHMKPHVVSLGSHKPVAVKKASVYALGEKYPLDSYKQVEAAAHYFEEYGRRFAPVDRRTYCLALVKRASDLGVTVSDTVQKYGSYSLAPPEEIKVAFAARRNLLQDTKQIAVLDGIEHYCKEQLWRDGPTGLWKAAEEGTAMPGFDIYHPFVICAALEEFDKEAGLDFLYDGDVPDPYFSVYGFEKKAEDADYSWTEGNDTVFARDLETLAKTNSHSIARAFNKELAKEFRKDPVGIFKSLPREQKKIISRMAAEPITRIELGV